MKGRILLLSKIVVVAAMFAQTTIADTMLPMIGTNGLNEPLYLTLCGIGLLVLGARGKRSV
ncbi:hypothetical protein [Marinagarivorans cellulosilyticus]|uniref:Uncharacterized protein n=1 Tax=Marinagarivorans cellulosilyticus TaxID=2721545 RepID=A0AAN1WI01_9GAMM|nr:hypothetical protein [Marinagarivorans cellulosilyticus]BCD97932.1 hypothetical protein MARGE09_P2133 [Marinagarivorans cellulosilyticus]